MSVHRSSERVFGVLTVLVVAGLFCGHSLLRFPIPGVNEPHYLCKAKATWDPDWCAGDFFLQSANAHSLFFESVGFLTRFWSLETVALLGRVLSSMVLAVGWTKLATVWGLRWRATILSAVALSLITLTGNFSGEWVLGGFESKVPAWGLGFLGIASWLAAGSTSSAGQRIRLGLVLGLSTALHPVVGVWFVIAISLSELLCLLPTLYHTAFAREPANSSANPSASQVMKGLLLMNLAAGVAALPGVVPALQVVGASELSSWEQGMANRIQVFLRLKHHLDPTTFPPRAWFHVGCLLLIIVPGMRYLWSRCSSTVYRRAMLLLSVAALIALVGIAVGWHQHPVMSRYDWSFRAFLLKFYPFRLVDILLQAWAALTSVCVLRSGLEVHWRQWSGRAHIVGLTLLSVLLLSVVYGTRRGTPSGFTPQAFAEWKDACAWIGKQTNNNALFVTPRESFAFKWYAERAEVVAYKDCPQDGPGILEWRQRQRDLGWMRPVQLQRPLKPSDLRWLQDHFGMTHLLTRDHHVHGQAPLYQNGVWRIYDVRPDLSADSN